MIQKTLQKEFKIYLVIFAALVLTAMAGAAYIYRLAHQQVPEPGELVQVAEKEAADFAPNRNTRDCVEESLRRLQTADIADLKSRVTNKLFLQKCLLITKKSTEPCDEIVKQEKNPNINTPRWLAHTCANHKEIHNVVCANTLEAVETFCHETAP